jgi:hypothetical protein
LKELLLGREEWIDIRKNLMKILQKARKIEYFILLDQMELK